MIIGELGDIGRLDVIGALDIIGGLNICGVDGGSVKIKGEIE